MRRFGELEAVIMDRLWARNRPMLVREVVDELHNDRALAYTTVMTVMENLYRKGWLRRERDGRAWRYEPTGSRSGYTAALMNEALGTSTDRRTALAHFVLQMSPHDAALLRQAAEIIMRSPAGLELRRMQMITEVGAEQNTMTIIMMPSEFVEMARAFGQRAGRGPEAES